MIDIKKYVKVKSGSQDMVLDQVLENGNTHEAVINPLNITPSKSAQVFTPPTGIDGYAPVSVSAVTASIDENIVSGNIKSGVNILGVEGNYAGGDAVIDSISITPTTSEQVISATGGVDGYSPITVNGVTASIDANITAENIKSGVIILGVTGNVVELQGEERTVSITSSAGETITPSSGKNGITSITVTPALETGTATPMTFSYTLAPSSNKCGFSSVTVSAVTASIDSNIQAGNIKQGVSILGVTGTAQLAPDYYIAKYNNNGTLENRYVINSLSGITTIGYDALYAAFRNIPHTVNVPDFSSITTIKNSGMYMAFRGRTTNSGESASGILDLRSVTSVESYGLYMTASDAKYITKIDLRSLQTVDQQYALYSLAYSTNLGDGALNLCGVTNIDLSSLETVSNIYGMAFLCSYSHNLTTIDLSSLEEVSGYYAMYFAFGKTTSLTSLNLGNLKYVREGTASGTNKGYSMAFLCDGSGVSSIDLSSLISIDGQYAMNNCFRDCTNLTGSIDLSSLTTARSSHCCDGMFDKCAGITSVDLSSLTQVGNYSCYYMFNECTGLTSVNLGPIEKAYGERAFNYMFRSCTSLTDVNLDYFVGGQYLGVCYGMFAKCYSLTSFEFTSLTLGITTYYLNLTFSDCTSLTKLSFPSLTPNSFGPRTDYFYKMLEGVTGCTVHFPSNIQSTIGSWSDVTNGFGGTNTTVLFDLPATNTLTGVDTVTYTRNPKYDTATALAWKVGAYGTTNFTPAYYTSGLTDPTVGTTIYSDSACTTSVTTVDSIA